jgi:hypothetical protein
MAETARLVLVRFLNARPANKDQKTAADFCDSIDQARTIAELTKERRAAVGCKDQGGAPDTTAALALPRL